MEEALSSINLGSDVESEIRNAVVAGNIATAHESQLNYYSWVGSGYLLINPKSGAGAYKISGGNNGSHTVSEGDAPENLLNFLFGVVLESVDQLGEAADRMAVKVFGWFSTAIDFFKIGKSCWNQFELLTVAVMVFSVLFFTAAFASVIVSLIAIIWLRIFLLSLMSFAAGLGIDGLRREYCGE